MIRLQDWYALTKEAKQLNWPKSVYSRKFVPVNVSSATGIVAGFLPSTSPTDAQNINTGSCYGILFMVYHGRSLPPSGALQVLLPLH